MTVVCVTAMVSILLWMFSDKPELQRLAGQRDNVLGEGQLPTNDSRIDKSDKYNATMSTPIHTEARHIAAFSIDSTRTDHTYRKTHTKGRIRRGMHELWAWHTPDINFEPNTGIREFELTVSSESRQLCGLHTGDQGGKWGVEECVIEIQIRSRVPSILANSCPREIHF